MVIDIDDENQSNHDDFIKICGKCEKVATHFCQTCNDNLCKFCIIDHYKNPDFTKITKGYQYDSQCAILAVKIKKAQNKINYKKNVYVEGGLTKIIALQMVTFIDPWKQVFWRATITSLKCAILMEKRGKDS